MADPRDYAELLTDPRESLALEFKGWLDLKNDKGHHALLAKAIAAMANHGGGHVVLGYDDSAGQLAALPIAHPLSTYSVDAINNLVVRYLEPAIHCDVVLVRNRETGAEHPIVRVPPGSVPIRAKRASNDGSIDVGVYYIRRPGPRSEAPASGQEWASLIQRCVTTARDELFERLKIALTIGDAPAMPQASELELLEAWALESRARHADVTAAYSNDHNARFPLGDYSVAYKLLGAPQMPSASELRNILRDNVVRHTGWPQFVYIDRDGRAPRPFGSGIEALLATGVANERPDLCDYWRASSDGAFFSIRGLTEDSTDKEHILPGKQFDIALPAWRVGEALLHAANMARAFGTPDCNVVFRAKWTGLKGRSLASLDRRRMIFGGHVSHDDVFATTIEAPADRIADALPELVDRVIRPLYERFSFFQLPATLAAEEMTRMRASLF